MESEKNKKSTVLVLGAGVAGCVTAYLLARKGYSVRILEGGDEPGGGCALDGTEDIHILSARAFFFQKTMKLFNCSPV